MRLEVSPCASVENDTAKSHCGQGEKGAPPHGRTCFVLLAQEELLSPGAHRPFCSFPARGPRERLRTGKVAGAEEILLIYKVTSGVAGDSLFAAPGTLRDKGAPGPMADKIAAKGNA